MLIGLRRRGEENKKIKGVIVEGFSLRKREGIVGFSFFFFGGGRGFLRSYDEQMRSNH